MSSYDLKVIDRQKGLARQKSVFIVEWEGVERKVPMFEFQESEETPKTILCNVDKKNIEQDVSTLYDRFYPDKTVSYTFKIKNKWPALKYYEVIDPRMEKDGIKQRLTFAQSSPDLEVGQTIKCSIRVTNSGKLSLHLEEMSPILMEFRTAESIFSDNVRKWLDGLFADPRLANIKNMYENEDGRWIFLFARVIEKIAYCILAEREDKDSFLREFCTDWLKVVEHSPFIAQMSVEQTEAYSADIANSIEICEDFLDALNVPDKDGKVIESINSLDPGFYQFRVEKRFRFLACAFSLDYAELEENIGALLEKLKTMGEEKCCRGSIAVALTHILKLYVNKEGREMETALSYDNNGTIILKSCALSLCYLTRILYKSGDDELAAYTSRLYQLLSLWHIFSEEDKIILLKNAYASLFINNCPLKGHQWEDFDGMVMNKSYLFCLENVSYDKALHLFYNNGNTELEMSADGFSLAPMNTSKDDMTSLQMGCGLTASLCYGKNLARLAQEPDFGNVQSVWGVVEKSVFAPAKVVENKEKEAGLMDGDDVDIYITEIIDDSTAKCRVVDYNVEGTMLFNDLFFYNKPKVEIGDFMGADGSPMLFPAIYHEIDGEVVLNPRKHKIGYAKEMGPKGIVTCYVISKKDNIRVAISEDGFFLNFKTYDENIGPMSFVDLYVNRIKFTGYADAEFYGFTKMAFDNNKVYRNYLKGINSYYFPKNGTLATIVSSVDNDEGHDEAADVEMVSETHVRTLADVVFKISRLEKELRQRYGYLSVCKMLSKLAPDGEGEVLCSTRMKYTRMLFDFSVNNRLLDMDVEEFINGLSVNEDKREVREMMNVVRILGRYGKAAKKNTLDGTLVGFLTMDATPLEKELSRLVLIGNMLTNFNNRAMEDHVLDELGKRLNINIVKKAPVSIGSEEGQNMEFKTSIVYPPTGDGNEEIDLQSDNIAKEISALMNATGGTLYIGVNDFGNVVGLQSDLEYFSSENETKAKDGFRNHFSNLLARKFGPTVAVAVEYDFEEVQGYTIFKVTIPSMPGHGGDYIRVGTTCQRK